MFSDKEKKIIKLIKDDPFIKQEDIAKNLGITRSAVAIHISNLQKKGIIKRGYHFKNISNVTVLGGINLAFIGKSNDKFEKGNNLGKFYTTIKGTVFNIYNYLNKYDDNINYLSFVGNDYYGSEILKILKENNIDNIELLKKDSRTGFYVSFSDEKEDIGAILSMEIFENLNVKDFSSVNLKIMESEYIYTDSNYTLKVLNNLLNLTSSYIIYNTITPLITPKYKELEFKISFIVTSIQESEKMFNIKFNSSNELHSYLLKQDIAEGLIYSNEKIYLFNNKKFVEYSTNNIREYYISKIIYSKKYMQNILEVEF